MKDYINKRKKMFQSNKIANYKKAQLDSDQQQTCKWKIDFMKMPNVDR